MITATPYKRLAAHLAQLLANGSDAYNDTPQPYYSTLEPGDERNFNCTRLTLPQSQVGIAQPTLWDTELGHVVLVRMDGGEVVWFELTIPGGSTYHIRPTSNFIGEDAVAIDTFLSDRSL